MPNPTPDTPRQRWVLAFLALGFAVILITSLWQRFSNPSLTIHRFAQSQAARPDKDSGTMPGMENMAAIGQLMESVARNPHDLTALLKLTESLMAVGQWESAENFALKALQEPGENPRAMYLLAVINHNQGRHAEAAELLEKMLTREENPSARYSLAILNIHFLKKPEAGREQLQKGLLNPSASPSLRAAMQEELAKLPSAADEAAEVSGEAAVSNGADDANEPEKQIVPQETVEAQDEAVETDNGKTQKR